MIWFIKFYEFKVRVKSENLKSIKRKLWYNRRMRIGFMFVIILLSKGCICVDIFICILVYICMYICLLYIYISLLY